MLIVGWRNKWAMLLIVVLATPVAHADQARLVDMPRTTLTVDGSQHCVRLAATPADRAAGFQGVPGKRMDAEAIYFVYDAPRRPSYHMYNVAQPLRLAWIAADGHVQRVISMQPETTGYRAPQPVTAVLEFTPAHPLAEQVRAGVQVAVEGDGDGGPACR